MKTASNSSAIAAEPRRETVAGASCYHCGEPCTSHAFADGEKNFCCQGCRTVHDLLADNGLEHFYDLNRHPGIRVRRTASREQWACLDDPVVKSQLLDFSDDRISKVTFRIPAIHCVACVWLLENLFQLHPGIGRSQVHFPRREVAISFAPDKIQLSEVVALLASIGYEPSLTLGELGKPQKRSARRRRWLQVGIAGFAFGNIMLFSVPRYLGLDSLNGPTLAHVFGYLSLLLALPVVIYSASDYWASAWLAFRRRMLTLDVPIALGLAALYGWSAFEILTSRGEGYLDSLSGLVFFLLCGRAFQRMTHDRLAFDRDYKSFFPLSVTRRRTTAEASSRAEESVSLSQLAVGDRVLVRNGELIPADAKLISERALIDYSFVTGESEPVEKRAGDVLYAGGRQVGAAIEMETVKAVSQSYLTSLWNHEAFQKPRDDDFNSLTHRYSRRFTRAVLAIAVLAAVFWMVSGDWPRGIKAFTSVLIVACPCALALVAPFTLGTAQRVLARLGVFLRNALVLERIAQVDTIVFDKTGTLTTAGRNAVEFQSADAALTLDEENWIHSLARQSTHPLSARISESLSERETLSIDEYREVPGSGIQGVVETHQLVMGSADWLKSRGVKSAGIEPVNGRHASAVTGGTVQLAIDGRHRGEFIVSSAIRPEVEKLLQTLSRHYETILLSGDHERDRERFRKLFGDDTRLNFNQSPIDKLEFIRNLQAAGKRVMMVGDGLNDAGALRQSDVGVAVVEKIGAFSPASDVIFEARDVRRLGGIAALARRATTIVRLGFVISGLYNLVGISIAAAGILSPILCAILMPVSSISVVLFACGATAWTAKRNLAKRNVSRAKSEPDTSHLALRPSDLPAS